MSLARDRANAAQLQGSDPAVSAFVGASAGSGKTKLLTDRLLRLMLAGAAPERIQCLTFTKAAAAEMAIRLQRRLGEWVTLDDTALDAALTALSVRPSAATRMRARALFAAVLDLPGGMRIETIHAFCQSLLRRFPLEASLSPHFAVADERETEDALTEAREDMLARANDPSARAALMQLAGQVRASEFHALLVRLLAHRDRLANARKLGDGLPAAQHRALGAIHDDRETAIAAAVNEPELARLYKAIGRLAEEGSPKLREKAAELLTWLETEPAARATTWTVWRDAFLTAEGKPYAPQTLVNRELARRAPEILEAMIAEAERVHAVEDRCRALDLAAISHALITLAAPVLDGYARRKDTSGLLDYDDLIGRSSSLLVDPGAAWVLYKLDGGLDHLLLDEVQDTAPAQWRIAKALTDEFFAGEGAATNRRTIFAVGDRKQSIFSFQGADAAEFDRARADLRRRVTGAGRRWTEPSLDVSFRSTVPVLALVDAVFANPVAAAGVCEPGSLRHESDRAGQGGIVELWPLAPRIEEPEPPPWTLPERNQGQTSAPERLAKALAVWIAEQTAGDVRLESRDRPLRPGDVMVLVRRRNGFARSLIRELKTNNVPVAGMDRLALSEQPAVQDLLALADALLLPQDDLQFACFLTSPLGGLSDASLMALAMERRGPLWEALRDRAQERAEWKCAWDFFAALRARVDYASPHAMLAEALGPLGARARLFARLGVEAEEAVDELLNAALAYAALHPPSLQGFLHWLRRSNAEVKREQESAGDTVRVMTVHGAKGLQAPLVILPDTTALPPPENGLVWAADPVTGVDVPLWAPRKDFHCTEFRRARDLLAEARAQEHNRLLYVALTRAEDRLVVCGWEPRSKLPNESWYACVQAGFATLGGTAAPFTSWPGERQVVACPQTVPPNRAAARAETAAGPALPGWAGTAPSWRAGPPPSEPLRPMPLAPSRPQGVELGSVPAAASPLLAGAADALERGRLVHLLLQHLPTLPPSTRRQAALAWLERPGAARLAGAKPTRLVDDLLALLEHPELSSLFGANSRAEVPISGMVGNQVVGGLVDRLVVLPDCVLIADYKTNRKPPASEVETPVLYLRQMAAYRAVLRQVYPGRPVRCVLIWTEEVRPCWLSDTLLDDHAPAAG